MRILAIIGVLCAVAPACVLADGGEKDDGKKDGGMAAKFFTTPLLNTKPAVVGTELSIESAALELHQWQNPDLEGKRSPPMPIGLVKVQFKTDIVFDIQLPPTSTMKQARDGKVSDDLIANLQAWNNTRKTLPDFKPFEMPAAQSKVSEWHFDLLLTLANDFKPMGHDVKVECMQGGENKQDMLDDWIMIPPYSENPLSQFLASMFSSGQESSLSGLRNLMPNTIWKSDTLLLGGPITDAFADALKDGSAKCKVTVGSQTEQKLLLTGGRCTAAALATYTTTVEPIMQKLESAVTSNQFYEVIYALEIIKMLEGYQACKALLEKMLVTKEETAWLPGQRRCMQEESESKEFMEDPCCSESARFEKCCPLQDVQDKITIIHDTRLDQDCDGALSFELTNALKGFEVAHKLKNDKEKGCSAIRRKTMPAEKMNQLFSFVSTCQRILESGQTKNGNTECTTDSECYTTCAAERSHEGAGISASATKKCSRPHFDWEGPFIRCGIDQMDPMLQNWLRKKVGVPLNASSEEFKAKIFEEHAEDSCSGMSAHEGACIFDAPQAECDANIFNAWQHDNWDVGRQGKSTVWVDSTVQDQTNCNQPDRQWFSNASLCVCTNQKDFCWEGDGRTPGACKPCQPDDTDPDCNWHRDGRVPCYKEDVDLKLAANMPDYDFLQDHNPIMLTTMYMTDSLDDARKCRLTKVGYHTAGSFKDKDCVEDCEKNRPSAQDVCDALSKVVKNINDWQSQPSVEAKFISFKPVYEWRQRDDGQYERVQTSNGNQAWCEYDKVCNHRPWDDSSATQQKCVEEYKSGDKTSKGDFFCAMCDGPWCHEFSSPSKCLVPGHIYDQSMCEGANGVWLKEDWGGQCLVDGKADHTVESCMSEYCPRNIKKYTDHEGKERTHVSYEFCEWASTCHKPDLTEADCNNLARNPWDQFPRWWTNDTTAFSTDVWSKDNGHVNGLTWVETDQEYGTEIENSALATAIGQKVTENRVQESEEGQKWITFTFHEREQLEISKDVPNDSHDVWGKYVKVNSKYWRPLTFHQWFFPRKPMCILWLKHAYGDYFKSQGDKSACDAKGAQWLPARRFEEGRWATQALCERGVCSSAPYDFDLAKDSSLCSSLAGSCSRWCEACDSKTDRKQFCVLNTNEAGCNNQTQTGAYEWKREFLKYQSKALAGGVCFATEDEYATCSARTDATILSCKGLGVASCDKASDPFYDGTIHKEYDEYGLVCFINKHADCPDKVTCESGGRCSDWDYENKQHDQGEGCEKVTCRIPFVEGNSWGGPDEKACWDQEGMPMHHDACIVKGRWCKAECEQKGGRVVERAKTEQECTADYRQGCFNTDHGFMTAIDKVSCENKNICEDMYKWKNIHEWEPGFWSKSQLVSDSISWKERALSSKNRWGKMMSMDELGMLVHEAGYALAGEAYKAEFKCQMEPLYDILQVVSCTCASDKADFNATCADILSKTRASTIAEKTMFANVETQTVLTAVGSFTVPDNVVKSSSSTDMVTVEVQSMSAFSLRKRDGRRQATSAVTSTCAQFELVSNSNGSVVGQLAGNGLAIKRLSAGTVQACVPLDGSIPLCTVKYTVQDFALGDENNRPGVPLQVAVTIDKSNQMCGQIPLNSSGITMVFPVMRTTDMQPYTQYVGKKVSATMKLDIASKELFTLGKMNAFKKSITAAIKVPGISVDKIVIVQVCDAAGCMDYTSVRRTVSGGITVKYEIQAENVPIESISSALQSSTFTSSFESSMATQGYVVKTTTTVVKAESVGSQATPPSPPVAPVTKSKLDNGAGLSASPCGSFSLNPFLVVLMTLFFSRI